jgi:hypothetical protein
MSTRLHGSARTLRHSRTQHLLPIVCALVMFCSRTGRAQQSSESRGPRLAPAFGVHYGTPMRFSVSAGGSLDLNDRGSEGLIAIVEQGQHGGEISAGYYHMVGRFGSGFSLRAAVLRTSGEPWTADPHTTYVGAEAHLMVILGVGGRVGYLRRASSTSNGTRDGIITLGASIGS